jgi:hypothetical protein
MSRHPAGPAANPLRTPWRFKSSHPHEDFERNAADAGSARVGRNGSESVLTGFPYLASVPFSV